MTDTQPFAVAMVLVAAVGLVAVLSNLVTQWLRIPSPALVFVGAAVAAGVVPSLHVAAGVTVQRVVSVALVCILFSGGMDIGWARLRGSAGAIVTVGVLGTILTVAGGALVVRFGFGLGWYVAVLVATAVAPTDPAVVFSVLGSRQIAGRAGTILEGESGANDPVGIALMASLISAGSLSAGAFGRVAGQFLLQMGVGLAVGVAGGYVLVWFTRRVALPNGGLYALRTLAGALLLFGVASLAHGSGFLAVFCAGIVLADSPAPYRRETAQFHASLASLGEIVAFVVLGLTVDLADLAKTDVWVPGLILAIALTLVIRPLLVGVCLAPAGLARNESSFVVLAGLKGAVPILLGSFILAAHVAHAQRLYGIVVVVVVFSVAVPGSLVVTMARLLRLPMRTAEPEPWTVGVRLRDEPQAARRLTVVAGSPVEGRTVADVADLPGRPWVSLVVRDGQLVEELGPDTELLAGDEVLVLGDASAFEPPPES